jgi:hypothetical protein
MRVSSLILGLAGLALLFFPRELVAALGQPDTPALSIFAQLTGTLYASLALMNWTAKDSLIGGVYARPVSLANFAHFFGGTLVLARAQLAQGTQLAAVGVLIGYAVFAIMFGWLVFGASGQRTSQPATDTTSAE